MTDGDDELIGLLAEITATPPPRSLDLRVVHAATALRPVGQAIPSLGGGVRANPAEAFLQTVDEFKSVLAQANGTEIVEPYGWSVTQLVAHLVEVDLYFGRQLGLWDHDIDESLEDDHLAMTEAAVRASVRADYGETVAKWFEVSGAVCAHTSVRSIQINFVSASRSTFSTRGCPRHWWCECSKSGRTSRISAERCESIRLNSTPAGCR
jgi:hypothetical protein